MNYRIIADVTEEPITLEQARAQIRIEAFGSPLAHPDDAYIQMLIGIARDYCESYCQRAFAIKTIEFAYDDLPLNEIEIPVYPAKSIQIIKYIDADGLEKIVPSSNYALDYYSTPNFIFLTYGNRWPVTFNTENNVIIQAIVGCPPAQVPLSVKSAMLLIVGHLYENRQQEVLGNTRISFNSLNLGVESLLQPHRLGLGV